MRHEKALREGMKKISNQMGWRFFRLEPQNYLYGMAGLPDLLICIRGVWVVIELKVVEEIRSHYQLTRKILRQSQLRFHSTIHTEFSYIVIYEKSLGVFFLFPSKFSTTDYKHKINTPEELYKNAFSDLNELAISLDEKIQRKKFYD